ncbi:dipeptidase PepV [Cytobacillus purgationiresistens]|uniref:Succinyl-diaminopimelate desuccinylase n=1 Tax=Cytobacillus purgationiresistens TaxID=863449 RepID=A0ABU0AHQ2_9BACI|nr:dipeptidase PepV [Cytobacillus purgationiresistens]MDQ0270585.1 succinyl-diaminopimelate desuccinylase [Cytobacillus purgationiresistens]
MNWRHALKEQENHLLNDLVKLLSIKSVKDPATFSKEAPVGLKIKAALDYMLQLAQAHGFRTHNIDGLVGYAEIGPETAKEYIAILCHLDVVPATGEWSSDPFSPIIKEGKLFARGAIDDKGPTMAAYYAIKLIKESGFSLQHRIRIIFGTDEESGMSCMKKYIKVEPKPLAGFAPDAVFPIIHAEKGQINAIIKYKGSKKGQIRSFYSGEKGNMVPDYAEAVISSSKAQALILSDFNTFFQNEHQTATIKIENDKIHFTLKGVSAHGMEPEKGINAGTKLAFFLADLLPEEPFIQFISARLHERHNGEGLNIFFTDKVTGPLTVNPGTFRYSEGEGAISLNIRCPVETPYLRTIEKLTEVIKEYGFDIEEVREKKPHFVDEHQPVIKILQHAYELETGENAKLLTTGGATYAQFIENGVAYGAVFPGKENTAHQINEYIILEDLYKAASIYATAIYRLANI